MQINRESQFSQSLCVEWLKFYFMSDYMIPKQPLESQSTGHPPLLSAILKCRHAITDVFYINRQSKKIQGL